MVKEPVVHLTARGVEFLEGRNAPYSSPMGVAACGEDVKRDPIKGYPWCRVEDIRAVVEKQKVVRIRRSRGGKFQERPVTLPTCQKCLVLLDAHLAETLRGPSEIRP